jgi:hypothetical protein
MSVESVNVGMPERSRRNGRKDLTGIYKSSGMEVQRRLMEWSGDDAAGACAADIIEMR